MKRPRWQMTLCVAAALAVARGAPAIAAAARASRSPDIGYVYPAGGRQGATFEVAIAGRYLDGVSGVDICGGGVQATLIEHVKPLNGKEMTLLRDRLKEIQELMKPAKGENKKTQADVAQATPAAGQTADANSHGEIDRAALQKEMGEIKQKLANPKNRNRDNPQLAEDVRLRVVLAPDAEPGQRELRLKAASGLSNPRVFHIGQLPEYVEKEPNNKAGETGELLALPLIVNGQIMPGDVDCFRFEARKGRQLVAAAGARQLIPYLADGVPGWFQATLTLYDPNGNELAYDDDYRFHPDPVLYCEIPRDGEYVLEIKDAIYRGREDFVYRIILGELPFVTSIFPLGGRVGDQTTVKLTGWNLPAYELTLDGKEKEPGVIPVSVRKGELARPSTGGLVSNSVPFALDTLPECLEKEPNNPAPILAAGGAGTPVGVAPGRALEIGAGLGAQQLTLPIIVNGRIDQPDDWDVFRFDGRAGDEIVAEVYARRLDSPLDSVLKLTDAAGLQLAFNDDHEDKGAGLTTHHADSLLRIALPADGTYYLHIGDAQHKGGEAYGYRLRISPPMPDFELRVVPSTINARAGATVPITVYALRKDGFSGEIALSLKDAPAPISPSQQPGSQSGSGLLHAVREEAQPNKIGAGFALSGGRVPADKDQVKLSLKAPPTSIKEPVSLSIEGHAVIEGREIVRLAVPADDMMQAFFYRHLVPAKDLKVAVIGRAAPPRQGPAKSSATSHLGLPAEGPGASQKPAESPSAPKPHLGLPAEPSPK